MKVQVCITLDKSLLKKLDKVKKWFNERMDIKVSRSQLIERAIRSYLKNIDFKKLEQQDKLIDKVIKK